MKRTGFHAVFTVVFLRAEGGVLLKPLKLQKLVITITNKFKLTEQTYKLYLK